MTAPARTGRTSLTDVEELLVRALTAIVGAQTALRTPERLSVDDREALARELAGAVAACEIVRLWVDGAGPRRRTRRERGHGKNDRATTAGGDTVAGT